MLCGLCRAYANTKDNNPTYAIDCVDLILLQFIGGIKGGPPTPVLRVAVAIEGTAGDTRITGIAFQANLQVLGIVVIPNWDNLVTVANGGGSGSVPSASALGLKINLLTVPNDGSHGALGVISLNPPAGSRVLVGTAVNVTVWLPVIP